MSKPIYFYQAKLIDLSHIQLVVNEYVPHNGEDISIVFHYDNEQVKIKRSSIISDDNHSLIKFKLPFDYPFGKKCYLEIERLSNVIIDLSEVPYFNEFDEMFNYDGDDLGSNYNKGETLFKVWAPLSDSVSLILLEKGEEISFEMERGEKGVYHLLLKGDYLNYRYAYKVSNFGQEYVTIDPYSKIIDKSGRYTIIVNEKELYEQERVLPKTKINKLSEAIIYELHVQDFTLDESTNIEHKGKFLGLIEKSKKTKKNHPAGLDYLKYLGITHIQLLPVIDYNGNDEANPLKDYNWGYDPLSFMALEGRYASNLDDGQARLKEFRKVVDEMHRNDIRVNLDIVYNHLYQHLDTCYSKIVPNYYFRRDRNNLYANASGCGNDVKSERFMVRKIILDAIRYLFKAFDIDGVRLDLMGLLDVTTVLMMEEEIKKIKEDAFIYGEGWNMGEELPLKDKACSDNASKLSSVGFFNDLYRDLVKGGTFGEGLYQKGFGCGNPSLYEAYLYAYMGSVNNFDLKKRFLTPSQSVNYVECHDNNTLFDKLCLSNGDEDEETLLRRIKLINTLLLLSYGVPFIHSGQEIGLSKCGLDNTYKTPKVNTFNYSFLDQRFMMCEYLREVIKLRKNELAFYQKMDSDEAILKSLHYEMTNDSLLRINIKGSEVGEGFNELFIIINVLDKTSYLSLEDYYTPLLLYEGSNEKVKRMRIKNLIVSPLSVNILLKKEE